MVIKPNFLIIGAAKSGTTSLYHYLRSHPEVFMPARKEPTFFAVPEAGGITDEAEYLALFAKAGGKKAIGEASISYLYDPESPRRIREFLGDHVKMIAILRNPVDMMYSLWGHVVRAGGESLGFMEGLAKERERQSDPEFASKCLGWAANYAYTARAMYAQQLERYYAVFNSSQIKVFIYEEFFQPGLPQYADLCSFLGIATDHVPGGQVHNPAGTVRSAWLRRVYNERMWWKEPLKLIIPGGLRKRLMEALYAFNQRPQALPALTVELRAKLQKTFDHDVRALEKLLGRNLSTVWF
jgi:hypothetical protein